MNTHRREPGVRERTHEIHVGWRSDSKAWLVTRGGRPISPGAFRLREHAIAFARAVAASRYAEMVVSDRSGQVTRHAPETLSYPTRLD